MLPSIELTPRYKNLAMAYDCLAHCDLEATTQFINTARDAYPYDVNWRFLEAELLARQGRYEESLRLCQSIWQTIEIQHRAASASLLPEPSKVLHTIARLHISLGHFQRGLEVFDLLRTTGSFGDPPIHTDKPLWNGETLVDKTLCIASEGGLGDAVCFARFAAAFKQRGARVVLATYPELFPLLQTVPGVDFLLDRAATKSAWFDYWLPALSCPRVLGLKLADISAVPFITCPSASDSKWSSLVRGSRLKVGLCWQGRKEFVEDYLRSIPASMLDELVANDAVDWYKVQLWEGDNRLDHPHLIDLTSKIANVSDLAGLIGKLDLLISVDTGPAHLAAAMGVETWLLNRKFGWITFTSPLSQGGISPWYQKMRVYTQDVFGKWHEPIERIKTALQDKNRSYQAKFW